MTTGQIERRAKPLTEKRNALCYRRPYVKKRASKFYNLNCQFRNGFSSNLSEIVVRFAAHKSFLLNLLLETRLGCVDASSLLSI